MNTNLGPLKSLPSGYLRAHRNHRQAQIKRPSPQPSPRASLQGEGVSYGGSGKMRALIPTRHVSAWSFVSIRVHSWSRPIAKI